MQQSNQNMENKNNDLTEIITQALNEMKMELGESFNIDKVNLAELERRTGITRAKLRRLKSNGFIDKPHGLTGRKAEHTVLSGYTAVIDNLLGKSITNASLIHERIGELGYSGGLTSIKDYIAQHRDLIPAKRQLVAPQGSRGTRYQSEPGESYQMDWGFVTVEDDKGNEYKVACFAMICHCCGQRYIEFFPNAKQENLFIGMLHAFCFMGIPKYVLTDNMKSVVIGRDPDRHPIWQHDYEAFMKTVGFETKLCKPRHPFTKGAVERLVRFVKDNFIPGRIFSNITELNYQALAWCHAQNGRYHRAVDCIPDEKHQRECWQVARILEATQELMFYLCPPRLISFDGFVHYEGRRFGVPYWYHKRICRIQRKEYELTIYDEDLSRILTVHDVTWSKKDSFCRDQYVSIQPEEFPSVPVKSKIFQIEEREQDSDFSKFDFGEGLWDE